MGHIRNNQIFCVYKPVLCFCCFCFCCYWGWWCCRCSCSCSCCCSCSSWLADEAAVLQRRWRRGDNVGAGSSSSPCAGALLLAVLLVLPVLLVVVVLGLNLDENAATEEIACGTQPTSIGKCKNRNPFSVFLFAAPPFPFFWEFLQAAQWIFVEFSAAGQQKAHEANRNWDWNSDGRAKSDISDDGAAGGGVKILEQGVSKHTAAANSQQFAEVLCAKAKRRRDLSGGATFVVVAAAHSSTTICTVILPRSSRPSPSRPLAVSIELKRMLFGE